MISYLLPEVALNRLVLTSTSLPPIGGLERVVWETAKRLIADYEVHILTARTNETTIENEVTIHSVPPNRPFTLWYSTLLKPKLTSILADISPSVIHFHQPLPWAYVLAKVKCPKVLSCHGLYFSLASKRPVRGYLQRFLLPRAIGGADIVCAPSKWLAELIGESYNVDCAIIPNGVDTRIFAPMEATARRSNVILYVGRLVPSKGVEDLLEAAKALPDYEFWLAGNGSGMIKSPPFPNVKLLGPVRDVGKLALAYNEATLCVFPSYWETFSLVGLEAMACGRAIIATKLGFSEYVEDGRDGLIVEPGRPQELIQSIKYLIENESERIQIERNAREKALKFDWDIITRRYKALYEKLL